MKRTLKFASALVLPALLASSAVHAQTEQATPPATTQQITLPNLGTVNVYRPGDEVDSIAVLLTSAKGYGASETSITSALTDSNTLVVALDTPAFLKTFATGGACADLSGALQGVVAATEKQLQLNVSSGPMLVGYAEGASYAYAALAQAPENAFKGGIGVSYDPKTTVPLALCKGTGLPETQASADGSYTLGAAKEVTAPFTVLQGADDTVVTPATAKAFFNGMQGAQVVEVEKGGHDFASPDVIHDQLTDEYWQIAGTDSEFKATKVSGLNDMPVTEIRDETVPEGDTFAIFLSGDGGWADLDNGVSAGLAKQGIPVVGISSLKYFWEPRTPQGVASDLSMVANHYLSAWHKKHFILVGYSFGADIIPFAANRLIPNARKALKSVALIGSSHEATFEFHITDWVSDPSGGMPTKPEAERLAPIPVVCVHGDGEDDSLCPDLKGKSVTNVLLSGGHHLDGAYDTVAGHIARVAEG